MREPLRNLVDRFGLLLRGLAHPDHRRIRLVAQLDHGLNGTGDLIHCGSAELHRLIGFCQQLRRLLYGLGRFCGKVANLVRHHGKALTRRAGTSSLNRGIQRENVGLERNILNRAGNPHDGGGRVADLLHVALKQFHTAADGLNLLIGLFVQGHRVFGIFGVFFRRLVNAHDHGGKLLHRGRLLGGAGRQRLRRARNLLRTGIHLRRDFVDGRQRGAKRGGNIQQGLLNGRKLTGVLLLQMNLHIAGGHGFQRAGNFVNIAPVIGELEHRSVERIPQSPDFVLTIHRDFHIQIALRDLVGRHGQLLQRGDQPFGDQHQKH